MTIKLPYDIKHKTDEKKHVRKEQNSVLCIPSSHPQNTNLIKSGDEINGWIISGRQLVAAVKLQIKKKIWIDKFVSNCDEAT